MSGQRRMLEPARRRTPAAIRVNRIALIFVPLLVLAAGCTAGAVAPDRPLPPFADCAALTAAPPRAPAGAGSPPGGDPLPDVALPCVTGGTAVRLTDLRGPAVINFWASWCPPCRKELPAVQRYATRAAGTVHVIGIISRDDPDSSAALATELGVSFPALADPDDQVLRGLRRRGLPVTVLIDRVGRSRYVHHATVDEAGLGTLVERHLGVRVGP